MLDFGLENTRDKDMGRLSLERKFSCKNERFRLDFCSNDSRLDLNSQSGIWCSWTNLRRRISCMARVDNFSKLLMFSHLNYCSVNKWLIVMVTQNVMHEFTLFLCQEQELTAASRFNNFSNTLQDHFQLVNHRQQVSQGCTFSC